MWGQFYHYPFFGGEETEAPRGGYSSSRISILHICLHVFLTSQFPSLFSHSVYYVNNHTNNNSSNSNNNTSSISWAEQDIFHELKELTGYWLMLLPKQRITILWCFIIHFYQVPIWGAADESPHQLRRWGKHFEFCVEGDIRLWAER